MPMRMPWMNSLEAIFDLLVDDNYVGHPNRKALLSNDYDSVGIACNCHTRFGQICVFEFTSPNQKNGLATYKSGEYKSCLDTCWDETSDFIGGDKKTVFEHCCSNVCSLTSPVGICTTKYDEYLAMVPEAEELFVFYRPYDPQCPDRKKDGECLEILDNPNPPEELDETTT